MMGDDKQFQKPLKFVRERVIAKLSYTIFTDYSEAFYRNFDKNSTYSKQGNELAIFLLYYTLIVIVLVKFYCKLWSETSDLIPFEI